MKYSVFIGRFQPVHLGHLKVIEKALQETDMLFILLGSCNRSLDTRNPFSAGFRTKMIISAMIDYGIDRSRVFFDYIDDFPYNDTAWNSHVKTVVSEMVSSYGKKPGEIFLIGHSKDHTSYYLREFPEWGSIEVENYKNISSTPIRENYLANGSLPKDQLTDSTIRIIDEWSETDDGLKIILEAELIDRIKSEWKYPDGSWKTKYPVLFVTVDAVVIKSGYVLMVKRGAASGKGMWALPGGYLGEYERIKDGIIRELKEETKIKVPKAVLIGNMSEPKTFDSPYRSTRGRVITHASLIDLNNLEEITLPKVRGSDDAVEAKWVSLDTLDPRECFEDHFFIIQDLVKGF